MSNYCLSYQSWLKLMLEDIKIIVKVLLVSFFNFGVREGRASICHQKCVQIETLRKENFRLELTFCMRSGGLTIFTNCDNNRKEMKLKKEKMICCEKKYVDGFKPLSE